MTTTTTAAVAGNMSSTAGAIGAVQFKYAIDAGFTGIGDPSKGVASVQNASGDYTQPTPVDVASALAYATQLPNGTHQLNFNGVGSTSTTPRRTATSHAHHRLEPRQGRGVEPVRQLHADPGTAGGAQLRLRQPGPVARALRDRRREKDVPGAVATTDGREAKGYSCGDLTPAEVAAGQTTPTCGVTNATASSPASTAATGAGSTTKGTSGSTSSTARSSTGGGSSGGGAATSAGGGGSAPGGPSAGVSLGAQAPLATTGGNPLPLLAVGAILTLAGWFGRRRMVAARVVDRSP